MEVTRTPPWLKARRCDRMIGPMDFTMNDESGVMIEGFAEGGPASFYALGDWRLQMNRALGLARRVALQHGAHGLQHGGIRADPRVSAHHQFEQQ